jgi:hypothetical protein
MGAGHTISSLAHLFGRTNKNDRTVVVYLLKQVIWRFKLMQGPQRDAKKQNIEDEEYQIKMREKS